MRPIDERILEALREHGNLTPRAIDDFEITSKTHASNRLSELADYGLVVRISRGLYGITDEGEAFLDERLDASELKPEGDDEE